MRPLQYQHLPAGSEPPSLDLSEPFAAVVIIEQDVDQEWRTSICRWLVDCGCLYMMAWGKDCSAWDDAVDWENISDFPDGEIPDGQLVMTTWHAKETVADVLLFAQQMAIHPTRDLSLIVIFDICEHDRQSILLPQIPST